jgi:septal ring factor EnvC (AmiA/AmiB activator)
MHVNDLVTWAGPGKAEALTDGLHHIRADMAKLQRTQDRHTRQLERLVTDVAGLKTDVAGLKTDVGGLKADMAEVKGAVQEILRRLPAA